MSILEPRTEMNPEVLPFQKFGHSEKRIDSLENMDSLQPNPESPKNQNGSNLNEIEIRKSLDNERPTEQREVIQTVVEGETIQGES